MTTFYITLFNKSKYFFYKNQELYMISREPKIEPYNEGIE